MPPLTPVFAFTPHFVAFLLSTSLTEFINREIERMRAEGTTSEEQIGMFMESVLYHEEEASYTQPPPQAMPDLGGYFLSPAAAAQIIEIALQRRQ
jgi:hypothetical protein